MNESDYNKYYKKGGTYVIPVEVFNELFDELERLSFNYEQADYKSRIDKAIEYIEQQNKFIEGCDIYLITDWNYVLDLLKGVDKE